MVTLLVLDGYGIGENNKFNAIYKNSPQISKLQQIYPSSFLSASGEDVGLSAGQMGNSETGHLNIGSGRVVYQDLTRINKAIENNLLETNSVILKAIAHAKKCKSKIHLLGLLSDGGVHSHINHLKELIKIFNKNKCETVVHAFLDGRDTPINSGINYLEDLQAFIEKNKIKNSSIASLTGRVYAMDRERRFDRVEKAYSMLVGNLSETTIATSLNDALKASYTKEVFDEFVLPIKLENSANIESGDVLFFFNFRTDRMRELVSSFGNKNFKEFETKNLQNLYIATMTEYDKTFDFANVVFAAEEFKNVLSEVLSKKGKKQFRVTETTKYAHITFFFNGGVEKSYNGEERCLIESINTQDFSKHPKMRAKEITKMAEQAILSGGYDFVLINLSNPDMIGHTGNLKATKKAIRFVDKCTLKIAKANLKVGADLIITADHGNAEEMIDNNGNKKTSHTTNVVPIILVSEKYKKEKLKSGRLADIAPTILKLLNIKKPKEFTGKSLI